MAQSVSGTETVQIELDSGFSTTLEVSHVDRGALRRAAGVLPEAVLVDPHNATSGLDLANADSIIDSIGSQTVSALQDLCTESLDSEDISDRDIETLVSYLTVETLLGLTSIILEQHTANVDPQECDPIQKDTIVDVAYNVRDVHFHNFLCDPDLFLGYDLTEDKYGLCKREHTVVGEGSEWITVPNGGLIPEDVPTELPNDALVDATINDYLNYEQVIVTDDERLFVNGTEYPDGLDSEELNRHVERKLDDRLPPHSELRGDPDPAEFRDYEDHTDDDADPFDPTDLDAVEDAKQAYIEGEIDLQTFEERIYEILETASSMESAAKAAIATDPEHTSMD